MDNLSSIKIVFSTSAIKSSNNEPSTANEKPIIQTTDRVVEMTVEPTATESALVQRTTVILNSLNTTAQTNIGTITSNDRVETIAVTSTTDKNTWIVPSPTLTASRITSGFTSVQTVTVVRSNMENLSTTKTLSISPKKSSNVESPTSAEKIIIQTTHETVETTRELTESEPAIVERTTVVLNSLITTLIKIGTTPTTNRVEITAVKSNADGHLSIAPTATSTASKITSEFMENSLTPQIVSPTTTLTASKITLEFTENLSTAQIVSTITSAINTDKHLSTAPTTTSTASKITFEFTENLSISSQIVSTITSAINTDKHLSTAPTTTSTASKITFEFTENLSISFQIASTITSTIKASSSELLTTTTIMSNGEKSQPTRIINSAKETRDKVSQSKWETTRETGSVDYTITTISTTEEWTSTLSADHVTTTLALASSITLNTAKTGIAFGGGNTAAISVVGLVFILLLTILIFVFYVIRRYKRKHSYKPSPPSVSNPIVENITVVINMVADNSSNNNTSTEHVIRTNETNNVNKNGNHQEDRNATNGTSTERGHDEDMTYTYVHSNTSSTDDDDAMYSTISPLEDTEVPSNRNNIHN